MDKELKAKWVAALRSGEYTQCKDMLHNRNGGFCCLGVLCSIDERIEKKGNSIVSPYTEFKLPTEQIVDCDLTPEYLEIIDADRDKIQECITMNDKNKSFAQIADYIEEKL